MRIAPHQVHEDVKEPEEQGAGEGDDDSVGEMGAAFQIPQPHDKNPDCRERGSDEERKTGRLSGEENNPESDEDDLRSHQRSDEGDIAASQGDEGEPVPEEKSGPNEDGLRPLAPVDHRFFQKDQGDKEQSEPEVGQVKGLIHRDALLQRSLDHDGP